MHVLTCVNLIMDKRLHKNAQLDVHGRHMERDVDDHGVGNKGPQA